MTRGPQDVPSETSQNLLRQFAATRPYEAISASGIATTEKDFYVINDTENLYLVSVGKLFEQVD